MVDYFDWTGTTRNESAIFGAGKDAIDPCTVTIPVGSAGWFTSGLQGQGDVTPGSDHDPGGGTYASPLPVPSQEGGNNFFVMQKWVPIYVVNSTASHSEQLLVQIIISRIVCLLLACRTASHTWTPTDFDKLFVARLLIGGVVVTDATIAAQWTDATSLNSVAKEDLYAYYADRTPKFSCAEGGDGNFVQTERSGLEFDKVRCKNRNFGA